MIQWKMEETRAIKYRRYDGIMDHICRPDNLDTVAIASGYKRPVMDKEKGSTEDTHLRISRSMK
jgi:hypothetical protein